MSTSNALPESAGDTPPAPVQALPDGARVGEYHVLRVLQHDEQGVAYLARDLLLQRDLTLYEHAPSTLAYRDSGGQVVLRAAADAPAFAASQKDFVERMQRQARFDHPAIAAVRRCWHANGTAYAALARPEGVTLQQARQAMGTAPEEAWLRAVMMPLLDALETVHAASVLHLGLTPTQVTLRADGRSQMLMFGSTQAGGAACAADAAFQAPELRRPADHLPLGAWTDLYALGALLYHAIVGHAPPLAEPVADAAFASSAMRGPAPAGPLGHALAAWRGGGSRPSYDMALLRAIDRALAPRPSDRPQSVAQFRNALNTPSSAVSPVALARAHAGLSPPAPPQSPRAHDAVARASSPAPAPRAASGIAVDPPELSLQMAVAVPADAWSPRRDRPPPERPVRRSGRSAVFAAGLAVLIASVVAGLAYWQDQRQDERQGALRADRLALPTLREGVLQGREDTDATTSGTAADSDAQASTQAPAPQATRADRSSQPVPAASNEPGATAPPPSGGAPAGSEGGAAAGPPTPQGAAPVTASPRAACAGRSNFSLLYCMQGQCEQSRFADHPQCLRLRATGDVE